MTFNYEYQMIRPAKAWLKSKGLLIKREFPTPWGICDLVGCSFNRQNVKKRLRLGQKKPIGSHFRVLLLSQIPEKEDGPPISSIRLVKMFSEFFDNEQITLELNRLKRDKFVHQTHSGTFYKLNGWMPIHKRIVALELKLSRVRDGLRQAITNLEFADESYVGLPMQVATRLTKSSVFPLIIEHGVGVVGLDSEDYRVLRTAKCARQSTDIVLQTHCVERFWKDYLKGNST